MDATDFSPLVDAFGCATAVFYETGRGRVEYDAARSALMAAIEEATRKLESAPVALMDTRTALAVCALTEEDFPALYALQGHLVALVDLGLRQLPKETPDA